MPDAIGIVLTKLIIYLLGFPFYCPSIEYSSLPCVWSIGLDINTTLLRVQTDKTDPLSGRSSFGAQCENILLWKVLM